MDYRIINKAKHLLIITLNSGKGVYLAPGEKSHPIPDMELTGNEKVEKLLRGNVIVTETVRGAAPAVPASATGKNVKPGSL